MGEAQYWITTVIGPAILLIVLVWLATRRRSNRTTALTEEATRDGYARGDKRRREGTDKAEQ